MSVKIDKDKRSFQESAQGVLGVLLVVFTFLMPLKFGNIVGIIEAPIAVPGNFFYAIYYIWPPLLFSFFSSFLLLAVILISPPDPREIENRMLIPLSWVLLFFSVLPGFINASNLDLPIVQTAHFAGFASFALAVFRIINIRPDIKKHLINAVAVSTVFVLFIALNQSLYTFKATVDLLHKMEVEGHQHIRPELMRRAVQTRVFAPFTICNSLAAHLILVFPIVIWGILSSKLVMKSVAIVSAVCVLLYIDDLQSSSLLFIPIVILVLLFSFFMLKKVSNQDPKKIDYIHLLVVFPILFLFIYVLYHTYSRAAILAFGISLAFFTLFIPINKYYKILFFLVVGICFAGVISLDPQKRDLGSLVVRLDYFRTAEIMFMHHPFAGTGWGDFFHEYTKIKTFPGTESPHSPHDFILSFASQAGLVGFLVSILVILLPFYIFFKRFFKYIANFAKENKKISYTKEWWFSIAVITGWCAWCLHSLADFNIQIPGTVATAIILVLVMNYECTQHSDNSHLYSERKKTAFTIIWYTIAPLIALTAFIISSYLIRLDTKLSLLSKDSGLTVFSEKNKKKMSHDQFQKRLNEITNYAEYSLAPWLIAGNYAIANRDWVLLERYTKEAIKRAPERASLYDRLALAQLHQSKCHSYLKNMKKAAELFPNSYAEKYKKAQKELGIITPPCK